MTLREYRRGPVPIQVRGYADICVVSYLYRHESRCFLEQYIHLHIATSILRDGRPPYCK